MVGLLAEGSLFTLMGRPLALVFDFLHSGTDHCEIIGGAHRLSLPRSPHSMTSSARASSDCGTVSASAFAVFRLMTSSNFVGCCTGRSDGLTPLRIRPT